MRSLTGLDPTLDDVPSKFTGDPLKLFVRLGSTSFIIIQCSTNVERCCDLLVPTLYVEPRAIDFRSSYSTWFNVCLFYSNRSHPRSISASSHRPLSAKHAMAPSPPSSERSSSARPRTASARPRPSSARITYSSHRDYIVSSACRDIPQSPTQAPSYKIGETKTSQMRLGLRKKTSDWMLKETRQYISKKPEDFKQRQPKRRHIHLSTYFSQFNMRWNFGECFILFQELSDVGGQTLRCLCDNMDYSRTDFTDLCSWKDIQTETFWHKRG